MWPKIKEIMGKKNTLSCGGLLSKFFELLLGISGAVQEEATWKSEGGRDGRIMWNDCEWMWNIH